MTEDEAKTKPCISGNAFNVGLPDEQSDGTVIYRCTGSACMAWRWSYPPDEAAGNKNGPQGYCGLAGRP